MHLVQKVVVPFGPISCYAFLMKIFLLGMLICYTTVSYPQTLPSLEEYSKNLNKELPEVYDRITKLITTTVEHHDLTYHFVIDVSQKEYQWAMPKVKEQVLKTICSQGRERSVLLRHRASLIYSYENVKGQSLGKFMVKPEHCAATRKN